MESLKATLFTQVTAQRTDPCCSAFIVVNEELPPIGGPAHRPSCRQWLLFLLHCILLHKHIQYKTSILFCIHPSWPTSSRLLPHTHTHTHTHTHHTHTELINTASLTPFFSNFQSPFAAYACASHPPTHNTVPHTQNTVHQHHFAYTFFSNFPSSFAAHTHTTTHQDHFTCILLFQLLLLVIFCYRFQLVVQQYYTSIHGSNISTAVGHGAKSYNNLGEPQYTKRVGGLLSSPIFS